MRWRVVSPDGKESPITLTDSEVAILAEDCVFIDATLKAFMPTYNFPANDPNPYLSVNHIGLSR